MPKKNSATAAAQSGSNSPLRFVLGFGLIVFGIILSFAIISFLLTGGADRSIFDMPVSELMTNSDIEVSNPLGSMGAWVADLLVTNGIGVMALLIPIVIMAWGVNVLGESNVIPMPKLLITCGCLAIWGSITLGFLFANFADSFYAVLGGSFGFFVAKWLRCVIGPIGTFALIFFVLFAYVAVKVETIREKVVSLLGRIHIRMPKITISTTEGDDIEPIAESNIKPKKTSEPDDEDDDDDKNGDTPGRNGNSDFQNGNDADDDDEGAGFTDDEPDVNPDVNQPVAAACAVQDGGMTIERPKGDDDGDDVSDSQTEENKENDLVILNQGDEEVVDEVHRGIDTKYDPTSDLSHYKLPSIDFLKDDYDIVQQSDEELRINNDKIVNTLKNFNISIDRITATVGPTVTLYEIVPAPGIRISKIQSLENDIAMSLAALGIRIIAPMPGRGTIGIEVPNSQPQVVSMHSVIRSKKFQESSYELPIALGKTISNETLVFDLTKTPHLLVAGATGQGKSVGLNAIITSILYKKHPSQVKFVLVDPKMVEFSIYRVLEKFFLAKVEGEDAAIITEVDKVKNTLLSLTKEMDDRYHLLEMANVRQIKEYNAKFIDRRLNPEHGHRFLPYIVVIIDEFADLIMQAGKEIEMPIARIAQKARAVGIHMILATQRPSTNIITGVIKAQFPSRIAFKVASMTDSRTIIDATGAQYLIGRGDLLFCQTGSLTPTRVQCAFIDTPEVEKITEFISSQQGYLGAYELPEFSADSGGGGSYDDDGDGGAPGKLDRRIRDIALTVVRSQNGSTSFIQRTCEVGFNRAGRLSDQLERMGIVSAQDKNKQRTVLVATEVELEEILQRFGV